jgi:glycerate kinase
LHPEELQPLRANTFGTGELIKAALDHGARDIVLGAGGSATVDGATGLLRALGVRFLGGTGEPLVNLPEELINLEVIDLSELDRRLTDCSITVMCDVGNPLLGEHGAAKVFGPQKGAACADVELLEEGLTRLSEILRRQTSQDVGKIAHGGAAGGTAAGLRAVLNAKLVNGIEYFLDTTGFDAALQGADVVISGEGRIDEQTLQGKAPYGVALRAKAKAIPVIALAGGVPLEASASLRQYFDVMLPIGQRPTTVAEALQHCAQNLQRTALELGNTMALCMSMNTLERSP